ncbi:hypothetical protein KO516_08155 [Citreicella sp. C3M06]|uniref:hypothetical protein n=1 Tax=Citreicella sp. C3M06 TaxID=2841564 RepID=UPI001C095306|nr:hypothetical protein [Citreicella sp. C3M06]MBU2960787.1 hypothetical protein [Citreicella sp. C3M06]
MQLRIGVIGPLATEAVDLGAALDTILKRRPGAEACDLENLTPNAPGFDRVATVELAARWFDRTGRTLRILAMNAASPETMDRIALKHLGTKGADENTACASLKRQTAAFEALRDKGHSVRRMDGSAPARRFGYGVAGGSGGLSRQYRAHAGQAARSCG